MIALKNADFSENKKNESNISYYWFMCTNENKKLYT